MQYYTFDYIYVLIPQGETLKTFLSFKRKGNGRVVLKLDIIPRT